MASPPPAGLDCANTANLKGGDQLLCLIQDPFKATVSRLELVQKINA